jgi:hypothetical protein
MANSEIPVSTNYFSDISGNKDLISLDALLVETGMTALTPQTVQMYIAELDLAAEHGVHSYLCNIAKAEKAGQGNYCAGVKDAAKNDKRLSKDRQSYGFIEIIDQSGNKEFYYFGTAIRNSNFNLPPWRGKKATSAPLKKFKGNQANPSNYGNSETFYNRRVTSDRKKSSGANASNFNKAVRGDNSKSIGHRAILFGDDGRVYKGANAIRDKNVGIDLSSSIPSETIATGKIPSKIVNSNNPKKTSKNPNKANVGATSDAMSGLAALGGLAAMVGIIAALMPLHFVTSAITFLTSITTMLTNVNNVANSCMKVVDGVLTMFGFGNTQPFIKLIDRTLANVFGKKNIQEAKSLFAQTVTTIATATKLLEKVSQGRAGTDNKIDEVAFSLGVVNNSMKDAGLIPPDSPYMQESKAIDTFVAAREKDNPELKENIDKLTQEIKTQDEIKKELKDEAEAKAKVKAKTDKDTNDLLKLVDATKTNVDKVREKDI